MKRYFYIILSAAICLAFVGCENTNDSLSSIGSFDLDYGYSSYSSANSDTEKLISDISSSEVQTSSVPSEVPQSSSSAPIPVQSTSSAAVPSSSAPAVPECKHSFTLTNNTATCTENGQNTYTCSLCGKTYKEQSSALGHKWNGHKCSVCGNVDQDKMKTNIYNWFTANCVEENFGKYYHLPSDSRYRFSALGGGNFLFYFDDEEKSEHISVSVYGFEKNKCYITYILNDLKIEGEFPMDAVHSSDRNFFNAMNAGSNEAEAKKSELISALRGKIDAFLKKFETEMLIPKTDVTLNNLGFTCY